jgi:hypothetical protein
MSAGETGAAPNLTSCLMPAVSDRPGVVERAFQVAKSGKVGNIKDVRTQLAAEGYSKCEHGPYGSVTGPANFSNDY